MATTLATHATGVLVEKGDGRIVLSLPHTDYRLHLAADAAAGALAAAELNGRIAGRIVAAAQRVDVVTTGGRYIEPLYGRPRRIQGTIVATDTKTNTITINCTVPVECRLMPGQRAADFQPGQFVTCALERGARFEAG